MNISSALDARVAAAMAAVLAPLDSDRADELLLDAHLFAQSHGHGSYDLGRHEMPELFKGSDALEQGWHDGYCTAAEMACMLRCPECQDRDVLICPTHG